MVRGRRLDRPPMIWPLKSWHTKLAACLVLASLFPSTIRPGLAVPDVEGSVVDILGVRKVGPLYTIVPKAADGRRHVTVALTAWIRRVGATHGKYDMPHQAKDALRLVVWLDDPERFEDRRWGRLQMPAEPDAWHPHLSVETEQPGHVLRAVLEKPKKHHHLTSTRARPYFFHVDLPAGAGPCFKLLEASFPMHKAPFCLPPAAEDSVCAALAPPERHSAFAPALWMVTTGVRHRNSTRDWTGHHNDTASRVFFHVSYHVAMGVSGLLLYVDELSYEYLVRHPATAPLIRDGTLRLVFWDMPERGWRQRESELIGDSFTYDQALVASHVMLGLSACGTELMVAVTDLDEFLYVPRPGATWPEPLTCLGGATVKRLQRFDVFTDAVSPEHEPGLWTVMGGRGLASGNSTTPSGSINLTNSTDGGRSIHPLSYYDRISKGPLHRNVCKMAALPAANLVQIFVHEAVPMYGKEQVVGSHCVSLLHVKNMFWGRERDEEGKTRAFRHWLFDNGSGVATAK